MSEPSEELRRLAPHVQLDGLTFSELTARRNPDATLSEPPPVKPQYSLTAQHDDDGRQFRLRLKVEIDSSAGQILVCVDAEFSVHEPHPPVSDMPIVIEYANEVGVMTMLPYLRHAIADLSQRVFGEALLMPVMPRGAVSFPLPTT